MSERLCNKDFWLCLRKKTRVKGVGKGQCKDWCEDVMGKVGVADNFTQQEARLGTIQIDQYATSTLVHYWLERDGFVADGTAGQFEPELEEGYYGSLEEAPENLKEVYSKRIKST